jgi:predicted nuclease of restriction endonuclease-like (RecB) superfamily
MFYANEISSQLLTVQATRNLIAQRAFENGKIANTQLQESGIVPQYTAKDPYLFDILGLNNAYLEADLEQAIISELGKFILEFGQGFTFVAQQKRMIIDGQDFHIDLLLYNRLLHRLVAVELKRGKFEAAYKSQMELYLKWLNRYERLEGENEPIGIILCASGNHEQIELLELDKSGIIVAEYRTELPPKVQFEKKIKAILRDAREVMEQRKFFC